MSDRSVPVPTKGATSPASQRLTRALARILYWVSRHWLALANSAFGLYVGLPALAPVLLQLGLTGPATTIYRIFGPLCHQLPERSYFIYGERVLYSYDQLSQLLGGDVPARYVGAPGIGYKVAICERDVAIYLTMLLAGILFALVRDRVRPLTIKQFGLMIVPMAVDGFGQLLGFWESTWLLRTVTGSIFGLGCIWLVYPYLHQGMTDVHREATAMLKEWSEPTRGAP